MPSTAIFTTTNFNPASKPLHSYIFNANGWIGPVGQSGLGALGYNAAYMDDYIEGGFASIGYQTLVWDVSAQFPNATYYYTISSAVTVVSGNTQTTTHYDQSGIQGGAGSEVIFDDSGDDIYVTGGGADLIIDLGGNNAIDAGSGNDVVWTLDGDDVIKAGNGDDTVLTWGGIDNVLAGSGNDRVELGDGDDAAWGQGGHDSLNGGSGADYLLGEGGNDVLEGAAGADSLFGGTGLDRLAGGEDNDMLAGGGSADVFVFGAFAGDDTITDFQRSQDDIELDIAGTGLASFTAVQAAATQQGANVVIDLLDGSITIENLSLNQMNAGQFLFV